MASNMADKLINKTILWDEHARLGARLADFAGYDMPINYGSQIDEHLAVRTDAGVFDVSHMVAIDIKGSDAKDFLNYIITNNVDKLVDNKALYTCMCNHDGGIIDDLIVYKLASDTPDSYFRLVVNAGTWQQDLAWLEINKQQFQVTIKKLDHRAILAVQGPNALTKLSNLFSKDNADKISSLKSFECVSIFEKNYNQEFFVARTGYTGEDGVEIIIPDSIAVKFWHDVLGQKIVPCGLGARDTLRLEAGLSLYGSDMDQTTTPIDAGLLWTVDLKTAKEFIGREALLKQKTAQDTSNNKTVMIGLLMDTRGVLRHDMPVFLKDKNNQQTEIGRGVITSGTYSPTLKFSIAIARVKLHGLLDKNNVVCDVQIRDKLVPVKIVSYPFVRLNKAVYK